MKNSNIRRVNISLNETVLEALDSYALRMGLSRSALITMIVNSFYLDEATDTIIYKGIQ